MLGKPVVSRLFFDDCVGEVEVGRSGVGLPLPVSVEGKSDGVLALIGCDVLEVSDEERGVVGSVFQRKIAEEMAIIVY